MVEYLFEPATFLKTQAWSRLPAGLIGCIAHKHNVKDEPLIFSARFTDWPNRQQLSQKIQSHF